MLEPWHLWIILGIVLWIIEIFTPGFVVGVFGTACLITALFAGAGATVSTQILVFGIASLVTFLGIRPLMLRYFYHQEARIRTNIDALIGKSGYVIEVINHKSGTGRVRIGGEIWPAITTDDMLVEIDQKVTVREIEGNKIVVEITK